MSASYQTSAKSRGRRDGEPSDKHHNLSRASSTASQKLTKIATKSIEASSGARNSRPSSPALFMQRNRAYDSKPIDADMISPKSSTASMKNEKVTHKHQGGQSENAASSPTIAESVKSKRSSESALGAKARSSQSRSRKSFGEEENLTRMISTTSDHSDVDRMKDLAENPVEYSSSVISSSSHRPTAGMQPRVSDVMEETFKRDDLEQDQSRQDEQVPSERRVSQSSVSQAEESTHTADLETSTDLDQHYPNYSYLPPSITTPAMSPPQSPNMYHYSNFGAPIPAAFPYTYMQQGYPSEPHQSTFLPGPSQADVVSNKSSDVKAAETSMDANKERLRLLEKMSNVLPDINDLLDYYQGNHSHLSFKEFLIRSTQHEHEEEVTRLQIQLSAKKEEYERVIGKLITENIRLKQDAEDQNEKVNSLMQAERHLDALKIEHEILKSKHQDVLSGVKDISLSKEQLIADGLKQQRSLDDVKTLRTTERERHDYQIIDLRNKHQEELSSRDKEHKLILSKVQLELANLITKHTQQKKDLEQSRSLLSRHEEESAQKSRDLETASTKYEQELASKTKENEEAALRHKSELGLSTMKLFEWKEKHEVEMRGFHETHRTEIAKAQKDVEKAKTDAEEAQITLVQRHQEQVQQLGNDLETEREAHRNAKVEHEETTKKHGELAELMTVWKTKHDEWQVENDKMNRMLESLGHRNAGKGKGDQYFTARFEQLAQDIDSISRQFFEELPMLSPEYSIMVASSFGLPDLMATTASAFHLRSLFVQHQLYRTLHRRIFQPFVFAEGLQVDDQTTIDHLLSTLSKEIRRKSVRREAIWRQITLRAIYTFPNATESASALAKSTVHEIMEYIQSLAPIHLHNDLKNATRHVVKAAIEIWRQVRIEIDNVTSSMPEASYYSHEGDDALLQIRPHIRRESIRLDQISTPEGGTSKMEGNFTWVYLQGTALRRDSAVVLQRRHEVQETFSEIE